MPPPSIDTLGLCDMGITQLPVHSALSRASMPPVTPWALQNPQVLAGWHNPAPILNESLWQFCSFTLLLFCDFLLMFSRRRKRFALPCLGGCVSCSPEATANIDSFALVYGGIVSNSARRHPPHFTWYLAHGYDQKGQWHLRFELSFLKTAQGVNLKTHLVTEAQDKDVLPLIQGTHSHHPKNMWVFSVSQCLHVWSQSQ